MIVTISGFSGSGKSTVSKIVAEKLGFENVDVGGLFRQMAKDNDMDVHEFGRYAEEHPEVDRNFDKMVVENAIDKDDVVLQGRLMGWLTKPYENVEIRRIWLSTEPNIRAERVAEREEIPVETALSNISDRDKANAERYIKTYGIDLNDLSVYDSVVRTDNLDVEGVVQEVLDQLK